jgi:hypothetical protein
MSSEVSTAMRSEYVDEDELRRIFNEGRYYERMLAGEFHRTIIDQRRRRRGDRNVRNAWSQTVEYRDTYGNIVARVHQYRKSDGSLGGSGRPDPKLVVYEEVIYILRSGEDWNISEP